MNKKFALLVLTIVLTVASVGFLSYETFKVRDIDITGLIYVKAEDVLAQAGIEVGESIFRVDVEKCRQSIDENPYVQVKNIRRVYPDKLVIELHEREVRAVVHWLGALLAMDEEGVILEMSSTVGDMNYPVVSGLDVSEFQPGKRVASYKDGQVEAMERILEELIAQNMTRHISEVNVTNISDLKLITSAGIVVRLGDAKAIRRQVQWLQAVIPELMQGGHMAGTLDLRSPEKSADFMPASVAQAQQQQQQQQQQLDEEPLMPDDEIDELQDAETPIGA